MSALKPKFDAFTFAAGSNPNRVTDEDTNETLLLKAIRLGTRAQVEQLVRSGGSIRAVMKDGAGAIATALARGSADMLECVIALGADINLQNKTGNTPLMSAIAAKADPALINILVRNKADLSRRNKDGDTAAHLAARTSPPALTEMLLHRSPNLYNKNGEKPLHALIRSGSIESIEALSHLWDGIRERTDKTGETLLHIALTRGDKDVITRLLQSRAADQVNALDSTGTSPFHIAIRQGHFDAVEKMIAVGADLSMPNGTGYTPIAIAVSDGQNKKRMLDLLLKNGASPRQHSFNAAASVLPLTLAITAADTELFNRLIDAGADINAQDKNGLSPLAAALANDRYVFANKLLDLGADPNLKDASGKNALLSMRSTTPSDLVRRLLDLGADPNVSANNHATPLSIALQNRRVDVAEMYLATGANVNKPDHYGNTPLMIAAQQNIKAVFMKLLASGADVKAKNNSGTTVLHLLTHGAMIDEIHHVLARGGDINARNDSGDTPLHIAAERGDARVVAALLTAGADPRVRNGQGHTAVDAAYDNNRTHLYDRLRQSANKLNLRDNLPPIPVRTDPPRNRYGHWYRGLY